MNTKKINIELNENEYRALDFALSQMESQLFNRIAGKEGNIEEIKIKLQKLLDETIDARDKVGKAWDRALPL